MREATKWVALLFIALVALSPIFEVFDTTDGWAQDSSDLGRYVICFFCFLAFSLRHTVVTLKLTSIRRWIVGPISAPAIERHANAIFFQGTKDRGLFLTFHDLRI
jgi:hypothetical protein